MCKLKQNTTIEIHYDFFMRKQIIKKICYEAVILIFAALIISSLVNQIRGDGINFFQKNKKTISNNSDAKEISLTKAVVMLKNEMSIIVDVRDKSNFMDGHIPGAIFFFEKDFDELIDSFLSENDTDIIIITYCDGDQCDLAQTVAEKFSSAGYTNVFYLKNGWSRWKEKFKE